MKLLIVLFSLLSFSALGLESECFGTTSNGRLENGVQLPSKGNNYVTYSLVARLAGRTYVHSTVHDILKRSWVRHDEHYHVDFVVACK